MKVSINENGLMLVEPEIPLEAYALGKWSEANIVENDGMLNNDVTYRIDNLIISATINKEIKE